MPLLMKEFGGQLKSVVQGVATEIDGDVFAALKGEGHQASPAYYEIKALLRRHVEANTHVQVKFAYTMAPTDDPHVWQYVVDATGESSPEFSPRGSIESFVTDDVVLDAARLGIPVADEEIRTYPQWGRCWRRQRRSATAPGMWWESLGLMRPLRRWSRCAEPFDSPPSPAWRWRPAWPWLRQPWWPGR